LFTKSDEPRKDWERPKKQRNLVFQICGYVMLTSLICIVLSMTFFKHNAAVQSLKPVFWFETIALLAFGISWLTKGQFVLKD